MNFLFKAVHGVYKISYHLGAHRIVLVRRLGSELALPPLTKLSTREERLARWQVKREAALALARNTVRLPRDAAPQGTAAWLEDWMWDARAARMAEDGSLLHEDGSPLPPGGG